jgi:hypothetical protein
MINFEDLTFMTEGRRLNENKIKKLVSFILYLQSQDGNTRIIYRGENYNNLKEKLNLSGPSDYAKLSQFLFLIGDKARTYRKLYNEKIVKRSKVYPVDCITEEFLLRIFEKINSILKRTDNLRIKDFINSNKDFCEYFSNTRNKLDFSGQILALALDSDKIYERDYYLYLLHQIGKIGLYYNSFFVSNSIDIRVALNFANSRRANPSDGIIIVSWVNSYQQLNFSLKNNISVKLNDRKTGLPIYQSAFYDNQKERLLKGGLFPHYILGYFKISTNEFEINPHFYFSKKL